MNIYASPRRKLLLILPVSILILSIFGAMQVKLGIDFRGGALITIMNKSVDSAALQKEIQDKFDLEELNVRSLKGEQEGILVEFSGEKTLLRAEELISSEKYNDAISLLENRVSINKTSSEKETAEKYYVLAKEDFKNKLMLFLTEKTGAKEEDISFRETGPSLGSLFLDQAKISIILAFIFISIVIYYYYRNALISFAVVQSAFFDTLVGYACLGYFGIPLSLGTIGALLMLIGYSVDSDIMLTDRILRRKEGSAPERAASAFLTGITMTGTALVAVVVMAIFSSFLEITMLRDISIILTVGLLGDLVATWCTNAIIALEVGEKNG
ncbi:MAG: hypothetical protein QW735_00145 [archaeon]